MIRRIRFAGLFAVVVLACACGSETAQVPTASPVVEGDAAGTAAPTESQAVVGPLLVYQDEALIVFDAGTGREVRRAKLRDGASSVVFTRAHKIGYVVESGSDVEVHAMDPLSGKDEVASRFPSPGTGAAFLLSPDGRNVAFALPGEGLPPSRSAVGVVDLASRTTRLIATFNDGEFRGSPIPTAWRDDGAGFVLVGLGHPGSSLATVMLDGTLRVELDPPPKRLSPNGRAVAHDDVNTVGCVFGVQRLLIHDLDTDQDVAVVEDAGRGLVFREWSPAGDELLYTQYATKPAGADECLPEFDPASGRDYVLSTHGGAPEPVADVGALRAQWYGGVRIEYACADGAPPDVRGGCRRGERLMLLNGVPVKVDDRLRILGVIDAEAIATDR